MKVRFHFKSGESLSVNMLEIDSLDKIYVFMKMNGHISFGNDVLIQADAVMWLQNEDSVPTETVPAPGYKLN